MKLAIIILLSIALIGVAGFQFHSVCQLRAQNDELTRAASETEQLRTSLAAFIDSPEQRNLADEIARLREDNRDLLHLRNEVSQLQEKKQELELLRSENSRLRAQSSAAKKPASAGGARKPVVLTKDNLSNRGLSTPEDAIQTFFWAYNHGDVQVMFGSLIPEKQNVAQQQNWVSTRNFYRTPPQIAMIEIVASRELGVDTIQLGIQIHRSDDGYVRKLAVTLKLINGEWKLDLDPTFW